jgi:hypothetical protein
LNPTPGSPCTTPGPGLGTSNVSFPYISGIYTGIDSSNEFFALFLFSFFFSLCYSLHLFLRWVCGISGCVRRRRLLWNVRSDWRLLRQSDFGSYQPDNFQRRHYAVHLYL